MNAVPDTEVASPSDYVAQIVAESGTSFALGMRALTPARRDAMYALYAFCRVVDDIVDEPDEESNQRRRLDEWRRQIDLLYDDQPTHPIARALAQSVKTYDLPKDEFLAIIDGMAMDLGAGLRPTNWDALELYCRRVAGAVGMISVNIFGVAPHIGPDLAVAQGEALQLTNILRDLAEDAAIGRLYLPADLLIEHGIESREPEVVLAHPNLDAVCRVLAARARHCYAQADALMAQSDRRAVKPSRLMLEMYRRVLDRLEKRGWQTLNRDVGLSKAQKIWVFLRYGL